MSMYIMKPWYKSRGGRVISKYTTSASCQYVTGTAESSISRRFVNFAKHYKSTLSSSTSANFTTRYSTITYELPYLPYSSIVTNGDLYKKFSTNATLVSLSANSITNKSSGTYSYANRTIFSTTVGQNVFSARAGVDDSRFSFCKNTNLCELAYIYTVTSSNSKISDSCYTSVLPHADIFNQPDGVFTASSTNLFSLFAGYAYAYGKSSYYTQVNNYGVVYMEMSDPYQVTIRLDNQLEQTEWRRVTYTNQVVTFYRATLTDL